MRYGKLTIEQINHDLKQLVGWSIKKDGIEKNFKFKDFLATMAVMVEIGAVAEELNHHPEWFN